MKRLSRLEEEDVEEMKLIEIDEARTDSVKHLSDSSSIFTDEDIHDHIKDEDEVDTTP